MTQVQAEPKANGKEAQASQPPAIAKSVEQILNEGRSVVVRGAVLKLAIMEAEADQRSLDYTIEDAIVTGLKAKQRSRVYTEETRNQREFSRALTNDPTIASDITRLHALMRKYKLPVPLTAQEK